jgi:hypothetical protein
MPAQPLPDALKQDASSWADDRKCAAKPQGSGVTERSHLRESRGVVVALPHAVLALPRENAGKRDEGRRAQR